MQALIRRAAMLIMALLLAMQARVAVAGHETRAAKEKASKSLRFFLGRLYELEVTIAAEKGKWLVTDHRLPTGSPPPIALLEASAKAFAAIEASLPPPEVERLKKGFADLRALLIASKPAYGQAYEKAITLRHASWTSLQVDAGPALTPDWQLAQKTYAAHCQSCHGEAGRGDGVLAGKLPTAMRDLTAPAYTEVQAPLMIYNLLLDGEAGSPMPAYQGRLSSRELWSLSYYVLSMARPKPQLPAADKSWIEAQKLSLRFLGQHSDYELRQWLVAQRSAAGQGSGRCDAACEGLLDYLRRVAPFEGAVER